MCGSASASSTAWWPTRLRTVVTLMKMSRSTSSPIHIAHCDGGDM